MILLLSVMIFAGCKDPGSGSSSSGSGSSRPRETVTVGSASFDMIYVQDQDSVTFPANDGNNSNGMDDATATLTTKFFLSETEVTNAVVAAVYQWAYDHNRFNTSNSSTHNYLSTTTVKHGGKELIDLDDSIYGGNYCKINYDGSGHFTVDTGYDDHPVVCITWYGAIMFCNWLTEMRDGNAANVVHKWVDNGNGGGTANDGIWQHGETTEDVTKNGYRLPGSYEWEYAARYRNDAVNTVSGYNKPWYTKGNSASDATTFYNDNSSGGGDPGKSANDTVAVYYRYWDGSSWQDTGVTDSATVKTRRVNDLELFDMSGNVWEWCFTRNGSYRVCRGGSWGDDAVNLLVGIAYNNSPLSVNYGFGFRLCRTR